LPLSVATRSGLTALFPLLELTLRRQYGTHSVEVTVIYFNVTDAITGSLWSRPIVTRLSVSGEQSDHLLGRGCLPVNTTVTAKDLSCNFEQKVAAVLASTAGATAPVFTSPDHPDLMF